MLTNLKAVSMLFAFCAVVASALPLMNTSAGDKAGFSWLREGVKSAYTQKYAPKPKTMYANNEALDVALIEPAAGEEDGVEVLVNFADETTGQ